MATVLKSQGVTFADGTSLTSRYNTFVQGIRTIFYQSSAPTGWTQRTESGYNDSTVRVTTGTGHGLTSGTVNFTDVFKSHPVSKSLTYGFSEFSLSPHTVSTPELPSHSHPANNTPGSAPHYPGPVSVVIAGGGATGQTGGGGAHTHPVTFTSCTGPFTTSLNFSVRYANCIVCSID
jgi:hypothetical protein